MLGLSDVDGDNDGNELGPTEGDPLGSPDGITVTDGTLLGKPDGT